MLQLLINCWEPALSEKEEDRTLFLYKVKEDG